MSNSTIAVTLSSMGSDFVPLLQAVLAISASETSQVSNEARQRTHEFLLQAHAQLLRDAKLVHERTLHQDPAQLPIDSILIDQFISLSSLAEQERLRGFTSSALSGYLFVVTQISNYLLWSEQIHSNLSQSPKSSSAILPFCGGALSSWAIGQASTLEQLQNIGLVVSRMAFWLGMQSERSAALHETGGHGSFTDMLRHGSWCMIAIGWQQEQLMPHLQRINDKTSQLPLYISAVSGPDNLSVSGSPLLLGALEHVLGPELRLSKRRRLIHAPIFAPYHSSHANAQLAAEWLSIIETLHIGEPELNLHSHVYTTVDGTILPKDKLDPEDLAQMILLKPCNWERLVQSFWNDIDAKQPLTLVNVGPGGRLAQSVARTASQSGIDTSNVTVLDLEAKSLQLAQQLTRASDIPFSEPIAIIGYSCRFPGGADTPEKFHQLLQSGKIQTTRIPEKRFKASDYFEAHRPNDASTFDEKCVWGAFLEDVDCFDARFFSISPREAQQMDPQHRTLTLVAHEALERAGYAPDKTPSFVRSRVGTFVGANSDDYRDNASIECGSGLVTGNARAFMAGRLSFIHQWSGPSMAVDAGEMSSLTAIKTACDSLWAEKCDTAVVGSVSVFTSPMAWIALDKAGMLSRTDRMQPFEAGSPDGWVRAEGCGVLVLKRLSVAQAEGDHIVATISSITSNFYPSDVTDVFGSALCPTGDATKGCVDYRAKGVSNCLAQAGLSAHELDYIECNASGFDLDEKREVAALEQALGPPACSKINIGSVKAEMGNAEAASGMAGIFKVFGLFTTPDAVSVPLKSGASNKLLSSFQAMKSQPVRTALINDYSLGGGNTCMVLNKWTHSTPPNPPATNSLRPVPFVLSAKSKASLERQMQRVRALADVTPYSQLCYTATDRRCASYLYRIAGLIDSKEGLLETLNPDRILQMKSAGKPTQIAFFFSGQGSQYTGMAQSMAQSSMTFRAILQECDRLLVDEFGLPGFLDSLLAAEGPMSQYATQCAIFSIEVALAGVLERCGIIPSVVGGHSLGEYAALVVAKVLTLKDALLVVASRARLLVDRVKPYEAGMLATGFSRATAEVFLQEHSQSITRGCNVACDNGPSSVVISGPKLCLEECAAKLKSQGTKACMLSIAYAFHSSSVEVILPDLRAIADTLVFSKPSIPILSNVTGRLVTDDIFSADYLCKHSRQTVEFHSAMLALLSATSLQGITVGLELGPNDIVLPMVRESVAANREKNSMKTLALLLPTMRKGKDAVTVLSQSLIQLYLTGANQDWFAFNSEFSAPRERIRSPAFPTYSFDLERHWMPYKDRGLIKPAVQVLDGAGKAEESQVASLPPSRFGLLTPVDLEFQGQRSGAVGLFEAIRSPYFIKLVQGHRVGDIALVPAALNGAMCLEGAAWMYEQIYGAESPTLRISNLHIVGPLTWPDDPSAAPTIKVRCMADFAPKGPVFSCMVSSEKTGKNNGQEKAATSLHATCSISLQPSSADIFAMLAPQETLLRRELQRIQEQASVTKIETKLAYQLFSKVVQYEPIFHSLTDLRLTPDVSVAKARLQGKHQGAVSDCIEPRFFEHPLSLDAMSQLAGLAANLFLTDAEHVYITESCEDAVMLPEIKQCEQEGCEVTVLATVRGVPDSTAVVGDCFVFREDAGQARLIGSITGAKYGLLKSRALQSVLRRTLRVA